MSHFDCESIVDTEHSCRCWIETGCVLNLSCMGQVIPIPHAAAALLPIHHHPMMPKIIANSIIPPPFDMTELGAYAHDSHEVLFAQWNPGIYLFFNSLFGLGFCGTIKCILGCPTGGSIVRPFCIHICSCCPGLLQVEAGVLSLWTY